jgi:hypothetical protein
MEDSGMEKIRRSSSRRPNKAKPKPPRSLQVKTNTLREIIGCAVVAGLLVVAVVMAFRVPADKQVEILQNVLSLLSVVIVALYGGQRSQN